MSFSKTVGVFTQVSELEKSGSTDLRSYTPNDIKDIASGVITGILNGDRGDISVTSGGQVWTVDNQAVTYAKIQNISATDRLLGRVSSGDGSIEEVVCTNFAQNFLSITGVNPYSILYGNSEATGTIQYLDPSPSGSWLYNNGSNLPPSWQYNYSTCGASWNGAGAALTTGKAGGYSIIPYSANIVGWSIALDTGIATIKAWKTASGTSIPTSSNSINTSGVSITGGTMVQSNTLTDFTTTSVNAGDIFAYELLTVSGATELTFNLKLHKLY